MKNSLLLSFICLLALATVFSQEKTSKNKISQKTEKREVADYCIMKGGKMYHYHNGKEELITKEKKWESMKVMPDGTCIMKDGKTIKLKEGQCCDEMGKIHDDCIKHPIK
jgi:hypothetical protein